MKSENQAVVWAAGAWCLILSVGLSYYLIRSFKRGVVMTPSRVPKNVSRAEHPGLYWFAMLVWLLFDLLATGCLLVRICLFFKPAS